MNWRLLCALAVTLGSSCGLLLDGAYLLSGPRYHEEVPQRRPTGQSESAPERRFTFEGGHLKVACEEVTRGVDRVWTVQKEFEFQGGIYQAHWVPVLLEGIVGAALTIGLTSQCLDPTTTIRCDTLYGVIPLGVDVAYSIVRLLMIDPPKLVDKHATAPHTEPHAEPTSRVVIACDGDTRVVATAASSTEAPVQVSVDVNGWVSPQDQARLVQYALSKIDAQFILTAGGTQQTTSRCEFFKDLHAASPGAPFPQDCAPPPSR